jgi:hypothetical protein
VRFSAVVRVELFAWMHDGPGRCFLGACGWDLVGDFGGPGSAVALEVGWVSLMLETGVANKVWGTG